MGNAVDLLSAYASERVIVTGASGFIGARLCRRLHELGADVVAVSRNKRTIPHPEVPPSIRWSRLCFDDPEDIGRLIRETSPSVIFHGSGLAHGQQGLEFVLPSFGANVLSTVNLFTAVARAGNPTVVLMGSMEESDSKLVDAVPASPYAASKEACNSYAKLFANFYHVPVVNCRLFMTYGPGQYYVNKLIPYVIMSLANGQVPRLGAGRREIDWVFVDDVVDGLMRAACMEKKIAQRVDLGTGRLVSIRWLVETIVGIMNSPVEVQFGSGEGRKGRERICRADIEHTKRQLGWAPCTRLEDGLRKTVLWYCDHKNEFQSEWKLLHQKAQ